jgi:uncharacterized membrane protein
VKEKIMAASVRHSLSQLPKAASRSIQALSSGVDRESIDRESINRLLGWFSLGLGVTQLLAPRALGRAIGVGEQTTVMRLCGAREIVSGLGLLSGRAPATFAMARVAGDAMDLALLGASLTSNQANPNRIAAAATAVAGVAAIDLYASKLDVQASLAGAPQDSALAVSLIINSQPQRVYEFWRQLDNLPRFMQHLASVEVVDERVSRWVARGAGGLRLQWESEIVEDRPNEFISWRTREGSTIQHSGSVRFEPAPGGRGTVVRVELLHGAPGGRVAAQAAKVLGAAPAAAIREDLRRLKQLLETGEIPTTRGQPSGARSLLGKTFTHATQEAP